MLAFIDVSGDPYSRPEKAPWIAIHSLCVKKRAIDHINNTFYRLKRDILNNEYIESKSTDLVNQSTLNNPELNKHTFLQRVVEECIDYCDCYHAAVIFENTGQNQKNANLILPRHYIDILWRIEAISQKNHIEDTLVIMDNNTRKMDKSLAFAFSNYMYRSVNGTSFEKIIAVPIFADSEITTGLQLSDLSAGIIRNYYWNNLHVNKPNSNEPLYHKKLREYYHCISKRSVKYKFSPDRMTYGLWYAKNYSIGC